MKYFVIGLLFSMGWGFGRFMINSVTNILLKLFALYKNLHVEYITKNPTQD